MFVNSILGSWPEDAIYTNVWSILNHKIEKFPCQQFSSVKFMFIGPWNLPYILAFCKSLPHWNQFDYCWQDKPFPLKKKKKSYEKNTSTDTCCYCIQYMKHIKNCIFLMYTCKFLFTQSLLCSHAQSLHLHGGLDQNLVT